jgi:hypothetical protein
MPTVIDGVQFTGEKEFQSPGEARRNRPEGPNRDHEERT